MNIKKISFLVMFLGLVFLIEWAGHGLTMTSVGGWYQTLQKPDWNPPAWVFGPVWTVLYAMIAVSGWLVFMKARPSAKKKSAFAVYGLQLLCNLLWSYFFFFQKSPGAALVDIWALASLISINLVLFAKLYRPAAILLIPYLIWTVFAAILNSAIWSLNR